MLKKPTIVSIVSTKGGVGKTTQTANLAGLLADLGQRVLAIDADMQDSLSKYLQVEGNPQTGVAEVLSRGGAIYPSDIVKTSNPNLDIVVSNITPSTQAWLTSRSDNLILLKTAMTSPVVESYDMVLIDTQGAKGELQRTAAMASDVMLSPFVPDMINFAEFFSGTVEMIESLNAFSKFAPELKAGKLMVFINRMDHTRNARDVVDVFKESLVNKDHIKLLETVVYRSDAFATARSLQLPVHQYDSNKVRLGRSACTMLNLVAEIFPDLIPAVEQFHARYPQSPPLAEAGLDSVTLQGVAGE